MEAFWPSVTKARAIVPAAIKMNFAADERRRTRKECVAFCNPYLSVFIRSHIYQFSLSPNWISRSLVCVGLVS